MTDKTYKETQDLLKELGLENLPEEDLNELYTQIGEVLFRGAMRRAWNVLDIKKQEELTVLLEASSADPENDEQREAIDTFLKENVPDFEKYVTAELEALKNAQQGAMGEIL